MALWQAHHVANLLRAADASIAVDVVELSTVGDRRTDIPIAVIGGKGVFVKEVQAAVLDGRADIAVHSAKDLPSVTPDDLFIGAVPERGDPRDVLIGASLSDLRSGSVIATGSARRRVQLQAVAPAAKFEGLRGNIATRLAKAPGFDAIVMANAALVRLGLELANVQVLTPEEMIPQVGQGTLAVECRADDDELKTLLADIDHAESRRRLDAERAFLAELGGDCDLPAGAFAVINDAGSLTVSGVLATRDGSRIVRHEVTGEGPETGQQLAVELRSQLEA